MPLAAGQSLTVGDLLAWPAAPSLVVLSSCEAARRGHEGDATGLSLAHAFVLGGARAVIAPSRPVDDALAAETMRAFYGTLYMEAPDMAVALRAAQLEMRRRHPGADWAAFRALGE